MIPRPLHRLLLAAALLLLAATRAPADIVLGNLPPTNDSGPSSDLDDLRIKGLIFTTGPTAYAIDNVIVRLENYLLASDTVQLGFFLDNGSQTNTGAQVGSYLQAPPSINPAPADFTFLPSGTLTLSANTTYWLRLNGADAITSVDWWFSSPPLTPTGVGATYSGVALFSNNGGTSYTSSSNINSFQINGTAVPEPAAALLLALGLTGWLGARRPRGSLATA